MSAGLDTSPAALDAEELEQRELRVCRANADFVFSAASGGGRDVDTFLKRVIAQRDHEQFSDEADAARARMLAQMVKKPCRVCGQRIGTERLEATVCGKCGGPKVQARLERQDAEVARVQGRRDELLALAGIQPTKEGEAMSEQVERLCTAGCGTKLGAANKSGICTPCQRPGRAAAAVSGSEPAPARRARATVSDDVRKQFKVLTAALGVDGDALVDRFCRAWIDKLKARVTPSDEDDYQLPGERS